MKIQRISLSDFQEMSRDSQCLSRDSYGDKVLLTKENIVYKIFRRKRLVSSALFFPYAVRFYKNAKRLKTLGIPTVDVQKIFYIHDWKRHVVVYPALPGVTLREKLKESSDYAFWIGLFLDMLYKLHEKGIYYRSLHFGNIFLKEDGTMALIDISDMLFRPWSLWLSSRAKNFRHFLRYSEDIACLKEYGWKKFVEEYMNRSAFSEKQKKRFVELVGKLVD